MTGFALLEGQGVNILQAVLQASLVNKIVLLLLVGFSVASWTVIVQKAMAFKKSQAASAGFRQAFRHATDWRELKLRADDHSASPLTGLFLLGFSEVTYQLKAGTPNAPNAKPIVKSLEAVERSLQRAEVVEMGRLERNLGILATVAAVSPFVGLFGTVWGIIEAFRGIGIAGNANLATVAPGIAEALVATAVGLIAAIPALMAYNFFQGVLKQIQSEMDDFSLEFINLSERNFS